jgi:AraC family transcriptional regulator of adaptative response/methylated-DNA-[protein]-cysteine methyltransferase
MGGGSEPPHKPPIAREPLSDFRKTQQESGRPNLDKEYDFSLMKEILTNGDADMEASEEYRRIERAIAFLRGNYLAQPDLAAIAKHVHLSEFHFQRLFTRWAGVSPKRFLQFLTVEHAKKQLADSKAVLDVTFDAGLSSSSRLYDLFVTVEAVTPGEFKSRGAGLTIRYGLHATRFGTCLLAVTERGICWFAFVNHEPKAEAVEELKQHWRGAEVIESPLTTAAFVERIFSRRQCNDETPLNLLLAGTNFQLKVWQALLRIPTGAVISYQALASEVCSARASRAVANAVASNPIAYLIPCHRVIRNTGVIGDYRWGNLRKKVLLGWEAARRQRAGHSTSAAVFPRTAFARVA